jgi:cystathionine beta-lyase/cystathionine gamma-synthase
MAALTTLLLATVGRGGHVVCSDVVYGGTVRLLAKVLAPLGVESSFVDSSDVTAVAAALRPETRLVLVETPANPTLALTDVAAVAELLRRHPARLAVDNTFLTAALQRPAELGADAVVYSTTKYVEGHNAALGGALLLRDEAWLERIDLVRRTTGCIQSPWNAWLTLKGLKTLPLRMERHARSALEIAAWLAGRPQVRHVRHPFHPAFPQRDLARRQQSGGGGIVTFEVAGGLAAARGFAGALRLCRVAENLGATETLLTHPATMSHADLDPEAKRAAGIHDGLFRLSVGLEAPEDLIADLAAALAAVPAEVTA